MTEHAAESLQQARHAFRDARRDMAAAVLAGDRRATVAAAWAVLRAGDRLRALNACPSARDRRTRVRWRRWALAALRRDPPDFGLLRRAMQLNGCEISRSSE
ncbi:hypothetical protein [Pseudoxanthomonas wuyuanensis]|uniref:Uncharacterized protein n=1 Tax=Pseudoxanthomonas wuyuanensis TaxID=1073196 RepID=A0A286CXY6_9GAMM|nr:hypothetical protein [Pseudoxanthomonas wuyuanensis]SOD51244.1 hypothetical protein SAMN06296416_101525 [Pseudoxanthomonas wuyuanensis]